MFTVESKWTPNKPLEAKHCYGTTSIEHPAVSMITTERGKYYLGARLFRVRASYTVCHMGCFRAIRMHEMAGLHAMHPCHASKDLRIVSVHRISAATARQRMAEYCLHTCTGGPVVGLDLPKRVFPCASPADVRSTLPEGKDVLAFQVRRMAPAQS